MLVPCGISLSFPKQSVLSIRAWSGYEASLIVIHHNIKPREEVSARQTCPKSRWLGVSGDSSTSRPSAPSICRLSCTAYPSPFTFKVSLLGFFLIRHKTLKLLVAVTVGAKVTASASWPRAGTVPLLGSKVRSGSRPAVLEQAYSAVL